MGLIEDQQGPLAIPKPIAQGTGVVLIAHQRLAEDEPRVGRPGVDAPAPLAPHPRDVLTVHHLEGQAEAALHLTLPLQHHRRRGHHHHALHLLSQQQLAHDQPGLDRFAEADVVGDEQRHPRHPQGLAQGLQLVGLHIDPRPQRRLEQPRVGGRNAVPLQGVQVAGEHPRVIEAPLADRLPGALAQDPGIHLTLPEHLRDLTVGVVIQAGQPHHGVSAFLFWQHDLLHQVVVAAAVDHATLTEGGSRRNLAHCGSACRGWLGIGGR